MIKYKNVLKSILACYNCKIILWICNLKLYNIYKKFIKLAQEKKIKVIVVEAGDVINIEKDIKLKVLWPDSKNKINENVLNNNSLVCKLEYKRFSIMLTGDIEEIAENAILTKYKNNAKILNANILKVAHHRL